MTVRGRKKVFVIVNPASGGGRPLNFRKSVVDALDASGLPYEMAETRRIGDATRLAALVDPRVYETVVATGGDGTINEVINGIAGRGLKLGLIPAGTINVLAKELSIPTRIPAAVGLIRDGRTRRVDVGRADDRRFVLMAGVGFDAYTIYKTDLRVKRYFRGLAYLMAALHALFRQPSRKITIELPGGRRKETGFFALISNSSLYGGRFPIVPGARIDDGLFDVLLFRERRAESLFRYFAEILLLKKAGAAYVKSFRTARLRVVSDHNVLVHTDAELAGSLPMEFSVEPRSLEVIVP